MTQGMTDNHLAAAYIRFYEALSPALLTNIKDVCHDEILFRDPFNETVGVDAYKALLQDMFRSAPDITFKVLHYAYDGDVCFLRWDSQATVKVLGKDPWSVKGMSELRFADDGRVISHIDHWDAASQFYERLPVIGGLLRIIRRRVAAH